MLRFLTGCVKNVQFKQCIFAASKEIELGNTHSVRISQSSCFAFAHLVDQRPTRAAIHEIRPSVDCVVVSPLILLSLLSHWRKCLLLLTTNELRFLFCDTSGVRNYCLLGAIISDMLYVSVLDMKISKLRE